MIPLSLINTNSNKYNHGISIYFYVVILGFMAQMGIHRIYILVFYDNMYMILGYIGVYPK